MTSKIYTLVFCLLFAIILNAQPEKLILDGLITSPLSVDIYPEVAGRIENIFVQVGDQVKSGQRIAVLDNRKALLKLKKIDAQVYLSQVEINQAEIEVVMARSRIKQGKLEAEQLQQEIKWLLSQTKYSQTGLSILKKEVKRREIMVKKGLESNQLLEKSREEYFIARQKAESSNFQYQQKKWEISIKQENINIDLERLKQKELLLKHKQIELEMTRAKQKEARLLLEAHTLVSPIAGVIRKCNVQIGEVISGNYQIVQIIKMDQLKIVCQLPESHAVKLHPGVSVLIKNKVYANETFEGKVLLLAPTFDPRNHSRQIDILVDNKKMKLFPGMRCKVLISFDASKNK